MSDLAKLIVGEAKTEAEQLPAELQELRKRFPGNAMVPMVERIEGKPSERVRMRRMLTELRSMGMTISCFDTSRAGADMRVPAHFSQSGKAYRFFIYANEDLPQAQRDELLNIMQEKMLEIGIPMLVVAHRDGDFYLRLSECTEEELGWIELGLTPSSWDDMSLDEALVWAEVFGDNGWNATSWREAGIDMDTCREWYADGDGFDWVDEAQKWMALPGMTAEIAIQLKNAYVRADQAELVRKLWPQDSD